MTAAELKTLLLATGSAEEHGGFVFLLDPKLSAVERAALAAMTAVRGPQTVRIETGWLCVSTGGTSGGVRFARHDEQTLLPAVQGFCRHFEIERVNAVDVLPAYHVSGLMARVRSAATGGEHVAWDWKRLEKGDRPVLAPSRDGWVISLVPTQLQRLMGSPANLAWLRTFRTILLGGGPLWADLAERATREKLSLSPCYGTTETAAMVTALRPGEFLAGALGCGSPLPHARISINGEGTVTVTGESVFRGYFPKLQHAREFVTEDIGRIDDRGQLHIIGRRDAVIITGGKKVQPIQVEAVLRASGEFEDVAVIGVPDAEWGQAVIACYPPAETRVPNFERAARNLPGYQRPKRFVAIKDWPRNAQGKVNRTALLAAAMRT